MLPQQYNGVTLTIGFSPSTPETTVKKSALVVLASLLVAQQAFATYMVVLRDGTKYKARERWIMVNGKALVTLENGTQLQIDPTLIDSAKTDEANASGLGDATVLFTGKASAASANKQNDTALADIAKQRKLEAQQAQKQPLPPRPVQQAQPTVVNSFISPDVVARIGSAYENVGLFGGKITPTGAATVRVELVTDNEDQVFKALSATAYLITRLPAATNTKIDNVELYLTTIKGGAAGKFNMTTADAQAIDTRTMSLQKYYVDRVIF